MPTYGETQKPAGVEVHNSPEINPTKTMRIKPKGFKIVPQEYRGNAALNANK